MDIMSPVTRFSVHPLVSEWLKLRIDDVTRKRYTEEAIKVLRLFIDGGDKKEMAFVDKQETLAHLDRCIENDLMFASDGYGVSDALMDAMVSFGSFYRRLGKYNETRALIERAMNAYSRDITPAVRNVLANMYCDLDELEKAQHLYKQAFAEPDVSSSADEPAEPLTVSTLGFLYWTQDDKLDKSGTKDTVFNVDHSGVSTPWFISTLSVYNGLGLVYLKQGRLKRAEEMFLRALVGREQTHGRENRYTLNLVDHLGTLYLLQGKLDQAESMYLRALHGFEKVCGPNYMMTVQTVNNIGLLYLKQGKLAQAEAMLNRASTQLEAERGPAHMSTLVSLHNLGLLYREQGKVAAAEEMLRRALAGWETNSFCIPEANTRYCLGDLCESLGASAEAKKLFQRAGQLYAHALGAGHQQTVHAMGRAEHAQQLQGDNKCMNQPT